MANKRAEQLAVLKEEMLQFVCVCVCIQQCNIQSEKQTEKVSFLVTAQTSLTHFMLQ